METGCRGDCMHVVETGCRVSVLVLGVRVHGDRVPLRARGGDRVSWAPGAGAGAVSWPCRCVLWLCAWWRQVPGAVLVPVLETGCCLAGCARGGDRVLPVAVLRACWYIIRCCRLSVVCLSALWGIYPLQVLFWPAAVSRAVLFARILLYV